MGLTEAGTKVAALMLGEVGVLALRSHTILVLELMLLLLIQKLLAT